MNIGADLDKLTEVGDFLLFSGIQIWFSDFYFKSCRKIKYDKRGFRAAIDPGCYLGNSSM
jgi:hypothetical protein